jgi:hypothetical protein
MTSALLEHETACDVAGLARCVALAAVDDRKGTGRPHRLSDATAVRVLLSAFQAGASGSAAAKASGFSEAAVRLWLKLGTATDARPPEAALVAALAAIRAAQDPVRIAALQVEREAAAAASAAAIREHEERQAIAAARGQRIVTLHVRLADLHTAVGFIFDASDRRAKHLEIDQTRARLDSELRAAAPAIETRAARERRYLEWRRLTFRGGPCERDFEMARLRNFSGEGFD